jgi:hypothetical protein
MDGLMNNRPHVALVRFADYRATHGWLLGKGTPHHHQPTPDVVTEFAKLADSDDGAIESFARTWGTVGPAVCGCEDNHRPVGSRTPIRWIRAHADNVKLILTLYAYLQGGDVQGLRRFLDSLPAPSWIEEHREATLHVMGLDECVAIKMETGDVASAARHLIAQILDRNLIRRDGTISRISDESLERKNVHLGLLASIYWQLADSIREHCQLKRCQECLSVFFAIPGLEFCPGLDGSAESQCAMRSRKRGERPENKGA